MSDQIKPVSEKTKLMIYGVVTAAVFIAALLIPLAFRGAQAQPEERMNAGERAALFADYWNGENAQISAESMASPGRRLEQACAQRMGELLSACTTDAAECEIQSQGSEYLSITSGEETIRVCRMWQQYQGDWRNWLDVCFDMDTGMVYYLYISSECIKNQTEYAGALPEGLNAKFIADYIDEKPDYELLNMDWSGDSSENAVAIYSTEGSAILLKISCIYYEATLLDIKITCA